MQTVHVQSQSGSDGILHLEVPVGLPDTDFEVVLVIQPRSLASPSEASETDGWPPGFFEETAGAWQGELVRDQGQFEEREGL